MTFIILGALAVVAIVAGIGSGVLELWFPRETEDIFSTLPWGEIIEGRA